MKEIDEKKLSALLPFVQQKEYLEIAKACF